MFFISKIIWAAANPISVLLCFAALGVLVTALGRRKSGLALASGAASVYLLLAFSPLGDCLLYSLENRERPAPLDEIAGASGIIVLGGSAMELSPSGTVVVHGFGGRMTGALELAQRFPKLSLVFSGGDGSWLMHRDARLAAEVAYVFFKNAGIEPSRIQLEDRSRNTFENAMFTAQLLKPKPQEKWVLVTSAFHMLRAKALFEAQGFHILPWPTDYQAQFVKSCFPEVFAREELCRFNVASKEWVGRAFYWLRGDIAHL